MKEQTNFISTVSAAQYREFKRWLRITLLSWGLVALGVTALQLPPLYTWYTLRAEYRTLAARSTRFEEHITKKRTLKDEHLQLDAKITRLERYQHQYRNPVRHLQRLAEHHAAHHAQIQSLALHGKSLELTSTAKDQRSALALVTALSTEQFFAQIDLEWLKQKNAHATTILVKGRCVYAR